MTSQAQNTELPLSHSYYDTKENGYIKQEEEACCNFFIAVNKLKHPNLP